MVTSFFRLPVDFLRLVGQRELLVGCYVDGFVVMVGQPVSHNHDGDDHDQIDRDKCAVARLPGFQEFARHYALHLSDSSDREVRNRPRKIAEM